MTIRSHIDARALNMRLGLIEQCAESAPEGTYEEAKRAAEAIGDIGNNILETFRAAGFKAIGDDRLRECEAVIYGFLLANNPEAYGLATGEGFGEHVTGPSGPRILANAVRDRDFLRSHS